MEKYEPEKDTDEKIAAHVQKGDTEAFGILVDRYEPKMKRYARKFLFGEEDSEDIVQDVLIKAYVNIQSFDTDRRFSPWIYRIAHNEFINAIKKKNKDPFPFFDPDTIFPHPVAKENPEGDATHKEIQELLGKSLESLDPKYKEPLILYYFEDMKYEEIAEIMRVPTSTVGVRLKRAKEALKKEYQKTCP